VPQGPGIGFTVRRNLVERWTARKNSWNAKQTAA
jgi:hypothetical protein